MLALHPDGERRFRGKTLKSFARFTVQLIFFG